MSIAATSMDCALSQLPLSCFFMPEFRDLVAGIAGVDVFFVISGFLITSIIMDEIADGRFSIARFYERRIRRIFPALFAMLAVSCVVASVLFLPHEFRDFANSLTAATLFVSNFFFWQTTDYFSGPAHLKPLLHTWSLAVEEQFYIVFPVLLAAIQRWGRGAFRSLLLLFFAISLAISVWSVTEKPVAGFYLAPSRAWELLLGALLAMGVPPAIGNRLIREALGALGLLAIGWAVTTYSPATPFPGYHALAPCLGAGLLIYSGQGSPTYASRLLSLKPMVALGLISYSLYLWHWPVLVFARHWHGGVLSAGQTTDLVLISVGLAFASWKYIEQPFRSGNWRFEQKVLFRGAGAVMAGAVAFGIIATCLGRLARPVQGISPAGNSRPRGLEDAPVLLASRSRSVELRRSRGVRRRRRDRAVGAGLG